jgi:hypothetical protein
MPGATVVVSVGTNAQRRQHQWQRTFRSRTCRRQPTGFAWAFGLRGANSGLVLRNGKVARPTIARPVTLPKR